MIDGFIMLGLPLLSIAFAIGAPIAAWLRRTQLAWMLLSASWMIWPLMLVIGLSNQSAHGTGGLYYLDLWALLGLPVATIVAATIAGIIILIGRKRASLEHEYSETAE